MSIQRMIFIQDGIRSLHNKAKKELEKEQTSEYYEGVYKATNVMIELLDEQIMLEEKDIQELLESNSHETYGLLNTNC